MTDRYAAVLVVLDRDLRSDDAECTLTALREIKGVLRVEPMVRTPDLLVATTRARHALGERLLKALREPLDGEDY